jgi:hypothetical protein
MDCQIIAARLAVRRQQVSMIEDELVGACERAAGHGRPGWRPPQDRGAWDRQMWDRYLREALAQEHKLGPQLRHLHGEIAELERLSSLSLCGRHAEDEALLIVARRGETRSRVPGHALCPN